MTTAIGLPNPVLKWDKRFLEMAKLVASWSKDPSTQTGAVIVDESNRVVSVGYNGFPRAVDDSPERYADRELKYKMIVHCERNALLFANTSVKGCTLYTWPFGSCSVCAAMVIQSGIKRCVSPSIPPALVERWGTETELAAAMFREAGIEQVFVDLEPGGIG
jgi:dCMP deaminase